MAFKKFRKMKVYNVSGYNYKDTPTIILKGDWLKETGFEIGSLIQVEFENGKVIITPREPEEVEYHAPCGKCMMVAEDCKWYGKKDTCPSLGALTINALAAADEVIIAANPQLLAMMGLQDFLKSVRKIKNRINPKLEVAMHRDVRLAKHIRIWQRS